jgi:hypothetical protein
LRPRREFSGKPQTQPVWRLQGLLHGRWQQRFQTFGFEAFDERSSLCQHARGKLTQSSR